MSSRRALLAAVVLPAVLPAAAGAQAPADVRATVVERGWIRLGLAAPSGSTVKIVEQVGGQRLAVTELTMQYPTTGRKRLAPWRCDRFRRTFVAVVTLPGGATSEAVTSVQTPGCARRFALDRPKGRAGRRLAIRVRDRFRVGDTAATVCAAPVGRRLRCTAVNFGAGQASAVARLRATRPGRWRIVLRSAFGQRLRQSTVVRRPGGRFRLLATGDSMIQIIDGFLGRRLGPRGGRVRSDAHISTGISKPSMLDWVAHARRSARAIHPDVTVVFLGANDGFPIGGAGCCGAAWTRAYAARASRMMASYRRRGAGRVYWLLLPAPRGGTFARVFRGVNAAVLLAARRFERADVRVLDLRRTFTPGGRFRQTIRYRGATRSVRQGDGVHLNVAGASIAADIIIRALRSDGYVSAGRSSRAAEAVGRPESDGRRILSRQLERQGA